MASAQALVYARSLKLKSSMEWDDWCKSGARPPNIPANPSHVYKHDGWQGGGHWLGTGNLHTEVFLPFKKALLHARSLKLKDGAAWRQWSKSGSRPANVPSDPSRVYKHDGWQGYGHWLGTVNNDHEDQKFLPFKEALLHARSLNLKTQKQWQAWSKSAKRPANMPSIPDSTYKHKGWQSMGHWLGAGSFAVSFSPLVTMRSGST